MKATNRLETTAKFKALFEEQKQNLLYSQKLVDEKFILSKDDLIDEADLCSAELDSSMHMRLRNREALYLKKIDQALARIADGTFGECTECGEGIELKRLEVRPTATHCVSCKEEQELKEKLHIEGHKHKSLGTRLRLA